MFTSMRFACACSPWGPQEFAAASEQTASTLIRNVAGSPARNGGPYDSLPPSDRSLHAWGIAALGSRGPRGKGEIVG